MANDYYTPANIIAETKARSALENSDRAAVGVGFDRLPTKATMDAGSVWFVSDTGAADVYTVAMQKTASSYTDGMSFTMKVANTNTGACTVNVDSLGAKAIKLANTTDPIAGDLTDGDLVALTYDADAGYFRVLTPVRSIFNGTASMSDAEIKTAYENNADTNALTDAEKSRLAIINIASLGSTEASKAVSADGDGDVIFNGEASFATTINVFVSNFNGLATFNANASFNEELQAVCYLGTVVALSGTTPTVDCDEGNFFTLTTSGNTTFTFSYAGVGLTTNDAYGFTLRVTAGGTHTITFPAAVKWDNGVGPDDPASGETDTYFFYTVNGGTTWTGIWAVDAEA